jgi:tricorn protease
MVDSAYLRQPHIAGELLTFVAEDDVWLVPATGGRAARLTADRAPAATPRLNPSGTHVAWASGRGRTREAYAVAVDGGAVARLTHWADRRIRVGGWLSDDEALVLSTTGQYATMRTWAHAVSVSGGSRLLPYGPAGDVALAPDGAVLVTSVYYSEPAHWKHYGGGTGGKVWLDPDGAGRFERILEGVGNHLVNAMFVGNRIAFLSDHEGVGALYSTARDGSDLRRHTPLGDFYARHATTDGDRVVFQCGGGIWLLDSLEAEPRRLEIALGGARPGREPFTVTARGVPGEQSEYSLDATGRVLAAQVRGTVHWLPAKDGPARSLLAEPGVRGRLPLVVPGRGAVLCVSDAGGEDGLDLIAAAGDAPARRVGHGLLGRVEALAVSPDGRRAAVASDDGRLLLVDLDAAADGAAITELDRTDVDDAHGLVFSPDSAYLAWAQAWNSERGTHVDSQIRLARLSDRTVVDVTGPRFDSRSPAFTHDGKYLAFLSNRTFDPAYDGHLFDLGFLPGVRPYLVTLAAETPSPFAPQLDGRPVGTPDAKPGAKPGADGSEGSDDAVPPVRVDLDGIEARIVPFPVRAGAYTDLAAVAGGVVWLEQPTRGELGETLRGALSDPPKAVLVRFDLGKIKRSVAVGGVDAYDVSGDGARIAYRVGGDIKIKPSDAADAADSDEGTVAVDLDRIRVRIDPVAEWTQMYHETWRLMRDNYWRADMNGLDWAAMRERYLPLVDRLGSQDDLVDLLWELHGELGTSHAYVQAPDAGPQDRQGLLGADLAAHEDGTWRVRRVLTAETSVADGRSPLAVPGADVRPGDAVVAVDGHPVDPRRGPGPLLAGKADRPVELTLRRDVAPEGDGAAPVRRIVVVPLASEATLRYHDLIASRRAAVRELSGGRLGYLHVPDMQSRGWAEFHRDHGTEITREGLVLDVRENAGGHTSALIIEKLTRRIIGWDTSRRSRPVSYPVEAPRGPVVALTDECAGSDGDIVTQAIKSYGIGPVVGTRTWGGVVGIDMRYQLVDGTRVTQPKYAFWFEGSGWSVENYGVDPDVEVPIPPHDWAAGRDPQLETAVRLALEALDSRPASTPPTS